ncbi:MAG: TonB-dependent receptor, partial [Croceicoccus sp.]|nr:TonB-dependent receptor [Croceicoccus sp.]
MKVKSYYLLGSALGAVASIGLAAPAMAQDADTDITADQQPLGTEPAPREIVVTGSYLRVGEPEDGALPVDVFGTEELETRGIDSPLEFIKNLPSVGTSLGDSNQYGAGNSQGVGSLNLRNLGRERTLVLFNGRRYMPEPGDGAVDTNLIPMFALDRIEVLKDGAASTYGSDAIAGVANFVTRRGFDGLVVDGNYTFIDGSDGDWQGSVLFGKNLGDANIMVGAGYQRRSELPTTERSFTQQPFSENPSGYSPVSNPGIYIPLFNGTPIAGPAQDGNQLDACENLGGIDEGAVCRYSYIPFVNLVEDQERYQ